MCNLFSSRPLFLGKIGLQKVFGTFLDRKVVFPDDNNFDLEYQNIVLWKLVNFHVFCRKFSSLFLFLS